MRATDGLGPRSAVDPTLADAIAALNDGGYWATAFDNRWRIVAQNGQVLATSEMYRSVRNRDKTVRAFSERTGIPIAG